MKHSCPWGHELVHVCEDGHSWRERPDGGVSPSWGMALTSVHYDGWDPQRCPEPDRDGDGRIACEGCSEKFYIGHGTPGVMFASWDYDERCQPAPPHCGKPPVKTLEWRTEGKYGNWADVSEGQLQLGSISRPKRGGRTWDVN